MFSVLLVGGDFSWLGIFIGDFNMGIFIFLGEGIYVIGLIYIYEFCMVQIELYVNIVDLGEVVVGFDQLVCIMEGECFLVGFLVGGCWLGLGIVDFFSGVVDLNQVGSGVYEYIYILVDDSNCECSDVMQLEINGFGELEVGEVMVFCVGVGEQQLLVVIFVNGSWLGFFFSDLVNGLIDMDQLLEENIVWYIYIIEDVVSGCVFFDSVVVFVNIVLQVELEILDYFCVNEDISIVIVFKDGISYSWIVNGINIYEGESILFNFSESGQYLVELYVINVVGCVSIVVVELRIEGLLVLVFELDINEGCGLLIFDFIDVSQGFDLEYFWEFSNGMISFDVNFNGIIFEVGVFDIIYQVVLSVCNVCGEVYYDDEVMVLV